jgi:hypothetical protein
LKKKTKKEARNSCECTSHYSIQNALNFCVSFF